MFPENAISMILKAASLAAFSSCRNTYALADAEAGIAGGVLERAAASS